MPTKEEHIARAKLNEEFGNAVLELDDKYSGWAIVAYFYSALHWLDAYFALKYDFHPCSHHSREDYAIRDAISKRIYSAYHHLYSDSRNARYQLLEFSRREISKANLNYLQKIKSIITRELKPHSNSRQ